MKILIQQNMEEKWSAPLMELLRARGYSKISIVQKAGLKLIRGDEQTQVGHPRMKTGALVIFHEDTNYDGKTVQQVIHLASTIGAENMIFIHQLEASKKSITSIATTFRKEAPKAYFEIIPLRLLHRTSRNVKIYPIQHFEWIVTSRGEKIEIPRPPSRYHDDPFVMYYGGRVGDCIEYEELIDGNAGPAWMTTMCQIVPRDDDNPSQ